MIKLSQFMLGLRCLDGHGVLDISSGHFVCPKCGLLLDISYDYERVRASIRGDTFMTRPRNLWRFQELLPVSGEPRVGRHSGFTPLLYATTLGRKLGLSRLFLKLDAFNYPTYSYKDRVVAVALQRALDLGSSVIACVSTGNVGNSLAALASKHEITPYVFYPTSLGNAKVVASMVCGATVIEVDGTYDEVNSACRKVGQQTGIPFVNISLRPFYSEGAKTFAYEILEQLDWRAPDHIIIPVAGTTLITKVVKGLREMRELKLIKHGDSRVHAAQAQGCAPVVAALDHGNNHIDPRVPRTIATSIAIGNPGDAPIALRAIRETGGNGASATDEEIIAAIRLIANTEGIFAEPAGGAAVVAAQKLRAAGTIREHDTVVIGITGTGLKTPEIGKLLWQNHAHTPCDVGQMINALESAATRSSTLSPGNNAGIGDAQHQRSIVDYYG